MKELAWTGSLVSQAHLHVSLCQRKRFASSSSLMIPLRQQTLKRSWWVWSNHVFGSWAFSLSVHQRLQIELSSINSGEDIKAMVERIAGYRVDGTPHTTPHWKRNVWVQRCESDWQCQLLLRHLPPALILVAEVILGCMPTHGEHRSPHRWLLAPRESQIWSARIVFSAGCAWAEESRVLGEGNQEYLERVWWSVEGKNLTSQFFPSNAPPPHALFFALPEDAQARMREHSSISSLPTGGASHPAIVLMSSVALLKPNRSPTDRPPPWRRRVSLCGIACCMRQSLASGWACPRDSPSMARSWRCGLGMLLAFSGSWKVRCSCLLYQWRRINAKYVYGSEISLRHLKLGTWPHLWSGAHSTRMSFKGQRRSCS